MKIKTKLTSGIGLLFMIIVLLGVLAISYIDKLADDTKNILSDNYNSLDYAKGCLLYTSYPNFEFKVTQVQAG